MAIDVQYLNQLLAEDSATAGVTAIQTSVRDYSVVILTASGGVISRSAGNSLVDSIEQAKARRIDFPDAKEIRVVCPTEGVLYSC